MQNDHLAQSLNSAIQFVQEKAIPIDTSVPSRLDCLEPLAPVIGNSRIVGVGESAHGLREFGQARHAMTRFLIERMGFEVVCAETEFLGSLTIDRYIQGEDVPEAEAMASHHFGRLGDVKDFLRWLRDYNQTASRRVRFYGIDMYRSELEVRAAVRAHLDAPLAAAILSVLDAQDRRCSNQQLEDGLQLALQATLGNSINDGASELLGRALRNVLQSVQLGEAIEVGGGTDGIDPFARDGPLAENALWAMQRMHPNQKIVVLTHNLHLQRYPYWEEPQSVRRGHLMGEVLAREIGPHTLMIGTTSGWRAPDGYTPRGPRAGYDVPSRSGSLDAVMDTARAEQYLVDLRKSVGKAREWFSNQQLMRNGIEYLRVAPVPAFDVLLHLKTLRISEGLEM
jgi:erythromycin esterase